MAKKILMKGNEAVAEAALHAGCQCYFGYPITPQTDIAAYMAKKMPKMGRVFIQAESEVAAINMVYGAAGAGVRTMTSSSSPGISLKQEGISYIAAAELPSVIVNMVRGGPGLGTIQPSQADYFQATKGGGHGDYKTIVYAPSSIQEMADLVIEGFNKADLYRTPVMILGDGMLAQMMEPVEFKQCESIDLPSKESWATNGIGERKTHNVIKSTTPGADAYMEHNNKLQEKYNEIAKNEKKFESFNLEDEVDIVLVAYGSVARICMNTVKRLEKEGIKVGLIRPITLWPFPNEVFEAASKISKKGFMVIELSCGQMIEDVKLAVDKNAPVHFYGNSGGVIPNAQEIVMQVKKVIGGEK